MDITALLDAIAENIAERVKEKLADAAVPVRPRLFDVKQTAVYLGRTERSIRELYKAGHLPSVKPDGRVQFDVHDLDRWIEQNKA